jgi:hypothetical protein
MKPILVPKTACETIFLDRPRFRDYRPHQLGTPRAPFGMLLIGSVIRTVESSSRDLARDVVQGCTEDKGVSSIKSAANE